MSPTSCPKLTYFHFFCSNGCGTRWANGSTTKARCLINALRYPVDQGERTMGGETAHQLLSGGVPFVETLLGEAAHLICVDS